MGTTSEDLKHLFRQPDVDYIAEKVEVLLESAPIPGRLDEYGNTTTHLAAAYSSLPVLLHFLEKHGADEVNYYGQTLLMSACMDTKLEKVRYLVDTCRSDVQQTDYLGNTALHVAAAVSSIPVIEFLLSKGADLSKENDEGFRILLRISNSLQWVNAKKWINKGFGMHSFLMRPENPLTLACNNNELNVCIFIISQQKNQHINFSRMLLVSSLDHTGLEKVKYFLDQGGSIHYTLSGFTPLHFACVSGNMKTVKYLLARGADIKSISQCGQTVLHCAAFFGGLELFRYITQLIGKDMINQPAIKNDLTPFQIVIYCGSMELIIWCVHNGANVKCVNEYGENVLYIACHDRNLPKLMYLERKLPREAFQAVTDEGNSLLHCAARYSSPEIIQYLIKNGADLKKKNNCGTSVLHYACMGRSTVIVSHLLSLGFDINAPDSSGETPLHFAAASSNSYMIHFIMEKGASFSAHANNGSWAIHSVIIANHCENFKYFLSKKEIKKHDINFVNNNGIPAFFGALMVRNILMTRFLIDFGADLSLTDNNGKNALHHACEQNLPIDIIKHLIECGLTLDVTDDKGTTPLHFAAKYCSLNTMTFLCNAYAGKNHTTFIDNYGNSFLHWSCCGTEVANVNFLLKEGTPINKENKNGDTPLHFAASDGTLEMVQMLISRGAEINAINKDHESPLLAACEAGDYKNTICLVEKGANINIVDSKGRTPLLEAATHDRETFQYLIKKGANIHHKDDSGLSLIHYAAHNKSKTPIKELLQLGFSLDDETNYKNKPIHYACHYSSIDVIDFVLQQNHECLNDKNHVSETPIHWAALNSVRTVSYLQEKGADFSVKTDTGSTPVYVAASKGRLDIVRYLLEISRVDIYSRTSTGKTLLHAACASNNENLVHYLVPRMYIDIIDKEGKTPLHQAAEDGLYTMVKCLIKLNANVNAICKEQFSPIHHAVDKGYLEVVKCLISADADPSIKGKDGKSLLHNVAGTSHLSVARYLLSLNRMSIEDLDENKATPILHAAGYGSVDMLLLFIENGADINVTSASGLNALHIAASKNDMAVIEYLLTIGFHHDMADPKGRTPLHFASSAQKVENIQALLASGANPSILSNEGNTPLHDACDTKETTASVVATLHNAGADINVTNKEGKTPLMLALSHDAASVVYYLLDNGADINFICPYGFTAPIHVAFKHCSSEIIKALLNRGANAYMKDGSGTPALGYCKESMDKEFLLNQILHDESCLDYLLQSIEAWTDKRCQSALIWFSFAGGNTAEFLKVDLFKNLTEAQITLLAANFPLYFINNKENILQYLSAEHIINADYVGLSSIISKSTIKIPRLQDLCRSGIRKALYHGSTIIPKYITLRNIRHLPRSLVNFVFLIDEMVEAEPMCRDELLQYLRENCSAQVVSPIPSLSAPQSGSTKYEEAFTCVIEEMMMCNITEQSYMPCLILDRISGTCLQELHSDLEDKKYDEFAQIFTNLYHKFFQILKKRDGPIIRCNGYGSFFNGTQVMELDELDYIAIESGKGLKLERVDDSHGLVFCVCQELSKQHYHTGTMKYYIHDALLEYLKFERRPEDPSSGQVYIQSCVPYPIAPAVCTVFAWQCSQNHRHHLSTDLTPAIEWKGKTLNEIVQLPESFKKQPFMNVKKQIEDLIPMLVLCPGNYTEVQGDSLLSHWKLTFCNTTEIMWSCLDAVSQNIRKLFKYAKVIRNYVLPYKLVLVPGTAPDKGSWHGGSVVSSWILYNILLEQVIRNPQSSCWTSEKFDERLLDFLTTLLTWTYCEFFTGQREQSLKWTGIDPKVSELLSEEITADVLNIMDAVKGMGKENERIDKVISNLNIHHQKETVLIVQPNETMIKSTIRLHALAMGRLRFDTENILQSMGSSAHNTVYYYKCPKLELAWVDDPVYLKLLYIINHKINATHSLALI